MAVVAWRRVNDGAGLSGKVGEPLRFDETWIIRVDSPLTSKKDILRAVPVGYYSAHWEDADCKAMEFKLSPRTSEGMLWQLSVSFYPPPKGRKLNEDNGRPEDFWERSGGSTTVPAFEDKDGQMIVNAAGDPLEGLSKEREEKTWTLTKYYDDDSWMTDVDTYAGSVNSDPWADGDAMTWKCYFKSAKRREIQNVARGKEADPGGEGEPVQGGEDETLVFVETVWEFRYEPDTWKLMPWDVGFHELVNGERKAIVGSDGKSVKQPVALTSSGTKKAAGEPPAVIRDGDGAEVYPSESFAGQFGQPFIVPEA